MMKDYSVFDLKFMRDAERKQVYRDEVTRIFIYLATFIEEHDLSTKTYLLNGTPKSDDVKIMNSELTDLGNKVVWDALDPWFNGHDRGKPVEDMWAFELALKKYKY